MLCGHAVSAHVGRVTDCSDKKKILGSCGDLVCIWKLVFECHNSEIPKFKRIVSVDRVHLLDQLVPGHLENLDCSKTLI